MMFGLDVSSERRDDRRIITAEAVGGWAPEIDVGAGQPIGQPQIAHAAGPELQEIEDDIEDPSARTVDLEQRHHGSAVRCQDDDGIPADHGSDDAFRVIRLNAQQGAGR